jgi:hypothetical protein
LKAPSREDVLERELASVRADLEAARRRITELEKLVRSHRDDYPSLLECCPQLHGHYSCSALNPCAGASKCVVHRRLGVNGVSGSVIGNNNSSRHTKCTALLSTFGNSQPLPRRKDFRSSRAGCTLEVNTAFLEASKWLKLVECPIPSWSDFALEMSK